MNVLLIGFRTAGKSTIGPLLARELRREFVEVDDMSAAALGAARPGDAIRAHGLDAFRAAEVEVLGKVLALTDRVMSLGGGTPSAPGAADLIQRERAAGRAFVVFLDVDAGTVRSRIAADGVDLRPPILGVDALAEVDEVLEQRRPLYISLADLRVEVRGGAPAEIARSLCAFVRNRER